MRASTACGAQQKKQQAVEVQNTYFPFENANAPGQRFDLIIAKEYSGSDFDDTLTDQEGIEDNAIKGGKHGIQVPL